MELTKVHLKTNDIHTTNTITTATSSNKTKKLTAPKKDKANNTVCFLMLRLPMKME